MGLRKALCIVLLPAAANAASPFTAIHPEEAYPDPQERPTPDPYSDFIGRVQERLLQLGFDAGPVNGDFGSKTQAALAQFQLSAALPASGQLDEPTLAALGVERDAGASAGATGRQGE
jgi:peptidoglycan hydrolase-like protein with peptidoglycan-binding domain